MQAEEEHAEIAQQLSRAQDRLAAVEESVTHLEQEVQASTSNTTAHGGLSSNPVSRRSKPRRDMITRLQDLHRQVLAVLQNSAATEEVRLSSRSTCNG